MNENEEYPEVSDITYEQIDKANKGIHYLQLARKNNKTGKVQTKRYAEVHERVKAFRKVYPTGIIRPKLIEKDKDHCIYECDIIVGKGRIIATATASETLSKGMINKTNMLENCETSAVGRALGFAGFGVNNSIATAEEIQKADEKQKEIENTPMTEEQMKVLANVDPKIKEQFREQYNKDITKLNNIEATSLINSLTKSGAIKGAPKQEKESVF